MDSNSVPSEAEKKFKQTLKYNKTEFWKDIITVLVGSTILTVIITLSGLNHVDLTVSSNSGETDESPLGTKFPPIITEESQKLEALNSSTNHRMLTTKYDGGSMTNNTCAPWLPKRKRRVLFVELNTWDFYYGPSKFKTGEYYMSATWDHALRKNGFTVYRVSTRWFYEVMGAGILSQFHRIFFRDPKWHKDFNKHDILCKARPMYFFGEWYRGKNDHHDYFNTAYDQKQVLVAHPETYNTFMGYFPHNILTDDADNPPKAERGRVGLLYGKQPEYFADHPHVIQALVDAGFELHTTCKDTEEMECPFPPEVIRHENVGPAEYANLMKKFSFMLGFIRPEGSPSPIVGLSYGVTFLNPLRMSGRDITQHKALSRLGMPYVYNVDLSNTTEVVQAAEWACKYRFQTYVPPDFREDSLTDRMCAMLEDDALCLCPNPIFGEKTMDWRQFKDKIDPKMDCRASTYTKKMPVFPSRSTNKVY